MQDKHLGAILMIVASLGLAVAVLLMKVIPEYTQMPPQHVAIWRFTIAAPSLWLVLGIKHRPNRWVPKPPWRFWVLGLVFTVASFSGIFALQRLASSVYVILIYIYPSLVVIYALLSGRSVPRLFWLGIPLTLLGVILTTFEFGTRLIIDPLGIAITLVNALALGVYMILSENAFKGSNDRLVGSSGVLSGAMLVGLSLIPFLGISMPETLQGWLLLLSFGLFGSLMPILAINISLGLLGAARGSLLITAQPVMTILLAMMFLNERLTLQQWIGGGLVILAIVLLQRSPDRYGKPLTQGHVSWETPSVKKP